MHPGAPAGSRYRGTIVADFHLPGHGDGCIDATAVGHRAVGAWASARSPSIAHADHEAHDVVAEALHEGARPALAGAVASAARSTTRRQAALAFVVYQAHRIGAEVIHRCAIGGIIRKSSPTQKSREDFLMIPPILPTPIMRRMMLLPRRFMRARGPP